MTRTTIISACFFILIVVVWGGAEELSSEERSRELSRTAETAKTESDSNENSEGYLPRSNTVSDSAMIPAVTGDPLEKPVFSGDDSAMVTPEVSCGANPEMSGQPDSGASARQTVADIASTVERTTNLTSITCGIGGIGPASGLAAIPCLAVQAVNITSGIIGWFFRKGPSETPEEPQGTGQGSEPQIFNDPR